jgi:hypothetical protein
LFESAGLIIRLHFTTKVDLAYGLDFAGQSGYSMMFRITAKALLLAALIATPADVRAKEANGFTRAPFDLVVPVLVQDSAARQQRAGRAAGDTAKRDSAGGRRGRGGQGGQGRAGQGQGRDEGVSALSLLALGLVGATLIGAAVFVYLMFFRARNDTHGQIPIVFAPREHVPAVPDFPHVPPAQFRRPPPEPAIVHSTASSKPAAQVNSAPNPVQGTMQLLPGRLEVTAGLNSQKEFRFVRVPGQPNVTFGRYSGEPHTHIQVDSPTVSRKHATMRFHMGEWRITNLSSTNPVIVNGEQLPTEVERVLNDGDQVEMGEVIFRFHAR